MEKRIRLGLVEDHEFYRKSLVALFNQSGDFELLFDFSNGKELLDYLNDGCQKPDIVILDIEMPVMNGEIALKHMQMFYPEVHVVMLSNYYEAMTITRFIGAGAKAFMPKDIGYEEGLHTIYEVHKNGIYFSEAVSKILSNNLKSNFNLNTQRPLNLISERELEILKLLIQNLSNDEIADKLCISKRTVEAHRNSLLRKTNSKNLVALIRHAIQNKIVDGQRPTDYL